MASWRGASVQDATAAWYRRGPVRGATALVALIAVAAAIWVVLLALADDEAVLVVRSTGTPQVQEGQRVLVSGVVRDSAEAVGAEGEAADFEGANVILATSVEPAPDGLEDTEGPGIDEIAEDEDLVGESVIVVGQVDEEVAGPRSFVLEPVDD